MLNISGLNALADNYIWTLSTDNDERVAVVDPGEAQPVHEHLARTGKRLGAILVTHHHPDHTAGIPDLLRAAEVPVYGPSHERMPIPGLTNALEDGDSFALDWLGLRLEVLAVPGHTLGHIALVADGHLFCGDTLFSAGCGKLFEGDAAQMRASLARLRELPGETQVYCGHEYTEKNLRFAQAVEPDNDAVTTRLAQVREWRAEGLPSLPSDIALERAINPFLRYDRPTVREAAAQHIGHALDNDDAVLAALREWKDAF